MSRTVDYGWYIWLYATNDYFDSNDNSEVTLANLPQPLVQEPDWLKFKVFALDRSKQPARDTEIRNGYPVHCRTQYEVINAEFAPFYFPEEKDQLDKLHGALRKQWIILCIDGNVNGSPVADSEWIYPDRTIHAAGNGLILAVKDFPEPDHDHDEGCKKQKIKFQLIKPILNG